MFTIVVLLIAAILLTLVSGCKKQSCTVTFKAVGEEDIVITTEYGKSITPPKVPEKIGNDGKWDVAYFGKITENFTVNAVYETRGLEYTPLGNGTGYEVSKGEMDENTQELFIPEKYNGARVIRIANSAFEECDNLKRAVLPDSVLYIGEKAFYRSAVKEINLPESLSFLAGGIDKGSFCETEWYNDHPDGVLYCGQFLYGYKGEIHVDTVLTGVQPKKAVAEGAFNTENCKNLKGIVLPEGYQTIGANAFRGCTALSEISLPDGLVSIGDNAFKDAILESVRLPDTLLSIGDGAFSGTKLTEINLPKTLKIVEAKVFANCKNLKTVILPSTLKTLNIDAFSGCLGLNLLIPKEIDEVLAFKPLSGIGGSSEPSESFKKAYEGVKIFYFGDETGWTGVRGEYFYDWIPVYYYSEDPPQESGKYWRYVDGVPTVWE